MRTVSRAAEGFDRRAFTVIGILRMQDIGIIGEGGTSRASGMIANSRLAFTPGASFRNIGSSMRRRGAHFGSSSQAAKLDANALRANPTMY